MIMWEKGLLDKINQFCLIGFFVFFLAAIFGTAGCSSSGGGGEGKSEYGLTGHDGFDDISGNNGLKFYSEFPWFVNVTYQVFDENFWGVSDLTVKDFNVLEDGVEVYRDEAEVNLRKRDFLPSDYTYTLKTVLFIDNTPSTSLNLEKMVEAAQIVVDYLDQKQQQEIAIVAYDESGDLSVIHDFTDIQTELYASLVELKPSYGSTNFYGGVINALSLWDDNESPASESLV